MADDLIHLRDEESVGAERTDVGCEFRGIEPVVFRDLVHVGRVGHDCRVREGEAFREVLLEHRAAGGV
jgi:hypothetical protein